MNREVDLVIANGWPVLDLVHNEKIPTLLHSGFLPSPLHFSKSIAHQRILFTAPGKADFIMTHDPEEYEFLNKYNDILGLGESERLLIKTRKNSPFSTQLTKSKTLQSFLTEPCIKPKRQSLMARIDEHYQNRIETLRRDLNEQRDSELLWMRKAFTQEIEKLLGELEELRNHLHHQEKQSDQPQHENLKLALEASEDRERKANDHIQQLEKELSKSSSVEPHVNSAEVEELRKTVGDLHSKLQRYKSQVPFVVAQWSYDFLLTYLVRLPLTILLLVYHIGTSLLHRYKMSRGSN